MEELCKGYGARTHRCAPLKLAQPEGTSFLRNAPSDLVFEQTRKSRSSQWPKPSHKTHYREEKLSERLPRAGAITTGLFSGEG